MRLTQIDAIQPPPQPKGGPEITLRHLVELSVRESLARGKSPVRYLSLGGDRPRARTGMAWNPSSLDGCSLKAVYKAVGVRQARVEPDFESQFIFDRGHVVGAWLAAYLRALEGHHGVTDVQAQCTDRDEQLVVDQELDYGGLIDISFRYYGELHIVEGKSKDNPAALAKMSRPDRRHARQLNDYMAMSGAKRGWLAYMGLVDTPRGQSFSIVEHPVTLDLDMWRASRSMIQALERFRQKPDRMPPRSENPRFECPTCPFRGPCERGLTPRAAKEQLG